MAYTIFAKTYAYGNSCQNTEYRSSWHWGFNSSYFPSYNASPYLIPPTTPEESVRDFAHFFAPGISGNDHVLQPVQTNFSIIETDLGENSEWGGTSEPMISPAHSTYGKPPFSIPCGAGSDFSPCGGSNASQCCSAYGVSGYPNNTL